MGRHAMQQARERGITINEISKVINQGAKHLQEGNKIISDFMHIRVVYKRLENKIFVITVMIR